MEERTSLHVTVAAGDDERSDRAARGLLADLREFPEVTAVTLAADGPAPEGSRSGELVAIGGLIVTMLGQPDAMAAVLRFVSERIGQRRGRVEVELDGNVLRIDGATDEQRDVLIDAFVRKVLEKD